MIAIIREHNLLNGYGFALVEYGMVSVPFGALAGDYVWAARWLEAGLWLGITANCLVIAWFAGRSLRAPCSCSRCSIVAPITVWPER